MSENAGGGQATEDVPPPIKTDADLWEPAGEPEKLQAAAAAWEAMAARLAGLRQTLDARTGALDGRWTGGSKAAFDQTWAQHATALRDGEAGAREMAGHLREVAQQVEATNQEVQALYVELAATAGVSVLVGLVSFGAGAAAGAARAALLVRRATRVKRLLSAFLAARRAVFALTRTSRIARFTSRFLTGAAETAAAQATAKQLAYGENPFDPGSWSATDLAGIATGGLLNPWAFRRGNLAALRGAQSRVLAGRGRVIGRPGRARRVRVVGSSEELDEWFSILSIGGTSLVKGSYRGRFVELPDGTLVGLRRTSTSGGPTIDIKLPDGFELKVHVEPWPPRP